MRKYLIVLLSYIAVGYIQIETQVLAQAQGDTLLARKYFEQGEAYVKTTDYKLAIDQFKKAKAEYQVLEDWGRVVDCLNGMAAQFWQIASYDSVISLTQKALSINDSVKTIDCELRKARSLQLLSLAYRDQVDLEYSYDLLTEAIDLYQKNDDKDSFLLATAYSDLGVVLMSQGKISESNQYLKKAIDFLKRQPDKNNTDLRVAYSNLSFNYLFLGFYNLSLAYAEQGLRIHKDVYSYRRVAICHYNLKNYDRSIYFYKKALELMNFHDTHRMKSVLYISIARLYSILGKHHEAMRYLKEANKDLGNIRPWAILFGSAEILRVQGNLSEAILLYQEVIDLVKQNNGYHAILSFNRLAEINQSQYDEVLRLYENAISLNLDSSLTNPIISNFSEPKIFYKRELLVSLMGKAQVLSERYKRSGHLNDLISSLETFKLGAKVIELMRGEISLLNDQLILSDKISGAYDQAIENSLQLYKVTGNKTYLDDVIYFSNNSRYNGLNVQKISFSEQGNFEFPVDLRLLEDKLSRQKNYFRSLLVARENGQVLLSENQISDVESKLFLVRESLDSIAEIKKGLNLESGNSLPKSYQLDLGLIQSMLNRRETILEYYLTDSAGYIFSIDSDTIQYFEIAINDLIHDIQDFRRSLRDKNSDRFSSVSHNLYQQLLEPVLKDFDQKELIIIPHSELWHLNFDLLLTEETDSENPKELPYLLKERTVSYANSISLLFNELNTGNSDLIKETLAFSYSDSSNVNIGQDMSFLALRDAGDDLPGSRKEIANIAEIVEGRYYFGQQSSEKNFKENADKYSILHLALHGELDDNDPQNSKLYFSPGKDSIEDNLLYSFELYNLNIPADLAILSACNTGDGKIAKGEGIMSLGSAFQYAGTKSLVLSSWEVSDDAAPNLMKYFYTNLKSGMNKAEALRQAKLKYLEEAPQALADPFYWGNFYLVGDNSPIEFEEDNSYQLLIVLVLGLALFTLTSILVMKKFSKGKR